MYYIYTQKANPFFKPFFLSRNWAKIYSSVESQDQDDILSVFENSFVLVNKVETIVISILS